MKIKTGSVISEDVRSRQKLCDAGAAVEFGSFFRKDVPDIHENQSEPSEEVTNELHHDPHAFSDLIDPRTQDEGDRISSVVQFSNSGQCIYRDNLEYVCIQIA